MKIVRYQDGPIVKWGAMEETGVREMEGDPFGRFDLASRTKKAEEVKLRHPLSSIENCGRGTELSGPC